MSKKTRGRQRPKSREDDVRKIQQTKSAQRDKKAKANRAREVILFVALVVIIIIVLLWLHCQVK